MLAIPCLSLPLGLGSGTCGEAWGPGPSRRALQIARFVIFFSTYIVELRPKE